MASILGGVLVSAQLYTAVGEATLAGSSACQAASCADSYAVCLLLGASVVQVHDGTTTPLNQFMKDPDSLITRVTWKDEQDKVGSTV